MSCDPLKYTKAQLVELAQAKGLKNANKLTKEKLCDYINSTDKDCISRSKIPLKDYQRSLVSYLKNNRGAVAAFSTGSGKTLTAVASIQCFLDDNPKSKVIVVTPVSLQDNFKKEIKGYGGDPNDSRIQFITLRKFAIDYSKTKCPKDCMLVIDEAHNLRTDCYKSKSKVTCSRIGILCSREAKRVLLLTATPVYNDPTDIINLVAMVKGIRPDYSMANSTGKVFESYFRCLFYFYDKPVDENYPTTKHYLVRIPMTKKYYDSYREVEQRIGTTGNPFVFLTGLRQASNTLDGRIGVCLKCKPAIKIAKEALAKGQKVMIASAFLSAGVSMLEERLKKRKIKYVSITGKTPKKDRDVLVQQFNSGKVSVILVSKSGREGLDLKGVEKMIIFDPDWTPNGTEQQIGRAVRYGSHNALPKDRRHVDIYHFVVIKPKVLDKNDRIPYSADQRLFELAREKKKVLKNFVDRLKSISINMGKC